MNKTKHSKEKELRQIIRQVFNQAIQKHKIINIQLHLTNNGTSCKLGVVKVDEVFYYTLFFDVLHLQHIILGCSDDYYMGRSAKIKSSIVNNGYKAIKFIIYHEIKHIIDRQHYGFYKYQRIKRSIRESVADDFAVANL